MSVEFRREMEKLASMISEHTQEDLVSLVEEELETIFGSSGCVALLREFSTRYGVTVEDAVKRPSVFQQALFFLLGDLGSTLVMKRIHSKVSTNPLASQPLVSPILTQ
jgi:hypothetical protein